MAEAVVHLLVCERPLVPSSAQQWIFKLKQRTSDNRYVFITLELIPFNPHHSPERGVITTSHGKATEPHRPAVTCPRSRRRVLIPGAVGGDTQEAAGEERSLRNAGEVLRHHPGLRLPGWTYVWPIDSVAEPQYPSVRAQGWGHGDLAAHSGMWMLQRRPL